MNGEWRLNITGPELDANSELNLVVAGAPDRLLMVEAGAFEVSEDDMYEAVVWGAKQLEPVVELIKKVQKDVGQEKMPMPAVANDLPLVDDVTEDRKSVV